MIAVHGERAPSCGDRSWRDNNLGGYSSLLAARAELRRTRLQRVREAGMQGRIQLPATSTHYDHGAQPRSKVFDFFLREENWIVWQTLVAQQRTNAQLNTVWPRPGIEPSQPCHPILITGKVLIQDYLID